MAQWEVACEWSVSITSSTRWRASLRSATLMTHGEHVRTSPLARPQDRPGVGRRNIAFSVRENAKRVCPSEGYVVFVCDETRDLIPAEIHSTNNDGMRIEHFRHCRIGSKLRVQVRRLVHIQKEKLGPEQAHTVQLILQDKVRLIRSAIFAYNSDAYTSFVAEFWAGPGAAVGSSEAY